jgi:hypothetical protein
VLTWLASDLLLGIEASYRRLPGGDITGLREPL